MKKLLFIFGLFFCLVANAQFQTTGAKTMFVNGLALGTKLDGSLSAQVDSNAIWWRADSALMGKYKGAPFIISSPSRPAQYISYGLQKSTTNDTIRAVNRGGQIIFQNGGTAYFLGESITRGAYTTDPTTNSYPYLLKQMLGLTTSNNYGLDGTTMEFQAPKVDSAMTQRLGRIPTFNVATDKLLSFMYMPNDVGGNGGVGFTNYTIANYKAAWDTVLGNAINTKRWNRSNILVCGVTWVTQSGLNLYATTLPNMQRLADFNTALKEVAAKWDVIYIDLSDAMKANGDSTTLLVDGLHPTDAGHVIIARELYKGLCGVMGQEFMVTNGHNGVRSEGGDAVSTSGLYLQNYANTRAFNWQLTRFSRRLDLYSYNGSSWNIAMSVDSALNVTARNDLSAIGKLYAPRALLYGGNSNTVQSAAHVALTNGVATLGWYSYLDADFKYKQSWRNLVGYTDKSTLDTSGNLTLVGGLTTTSVSSSGAITGTTLSGTIVTPSQTNITTVGTLGALTVTNSISGGTIYGAGTGLTGTAASLSIGGNAATASTAIVVTSPTQSSITSVGTLTALTISGALNAGSIVTSSFQTYGTFTPVLTFGGASVGITYALQYGYWIKHGNIIYYSIRIGLSSKGSSTGGANITGLPFTSGTTNAGWGGTVGYNANMSGSVTQWYSVVNGASTTVAIRGTVGGTYAAPTDAEFNNNSDLVFSGFYSTLNQ